MADLHDCLVDASKNGYMFTECDWHALLDSIQGVEKQLRQPAWKTELEHDFSGTLAARTAVKSDSLSSSLTRSRTSDGHSPQYNPDHIVDRVVFKVVLPHNQNTLEKIASLFSNTATMDLDLQKLHQNLGQSKDPEILTELKRLEVVLDRLYSRYTSSIARNDEFDASMYRAVVVDCHDIYTRLHPANISHPTISTWTQKFAPNSPTYWILLRASALYELINPKNYKFPFLIAGGDLCTLKAYSGDESPHVVVHPQWTNMKPRKLKRRTRDNAADSDAARNDGLNVL